MLDTGLHHLVVVSAVLVLAVSGQESHVKPSGGKIDGLPRAFQLGIPGLAQGLKGLKCNPLEVSH